MKTRIMACAITIAWILLTVPGASAQQPITIHVTQLDASRFPRVDVYVSVADAAGQPVRTLSPEAFRLEQNGQPVQLTAATRSGEQGIVNTVLIVDHSGSMAFSGKMAGAKQAATTFVNLMRPGDKTALVQFDTEIETLQPLTEDKAALTAAIARLVPRGNTALYDALAQGGKYFEATNGRKAIIVVTDGMDNASKLNRPAAIAQAEKGGYSIYTIGLGNKGAGYGSQEAIDEGVLRELATASMGTYAYAPDAGQLTALYQQLSFLIQNEYKLTFLSPDPLRDGLRRNLVVTAPGASTGQAAFNPGGLIPEAAPQWSSWLLFLIALAILVALVFVPAGLQLATGRWGTRAPARVKLSGEASTSAAPPAVRLNRIKLGRRAASSASDSTSKMPWDE